MAEKKNSAFPIVNSDVEKGALLAPGGDDEPKPLPSQEANRVFLGIPVQVRSTKRYPIECSQARVLPIG